jgi:hypothetical protein
VCVCVCACARVGVCVCRCRCACMCVRVYVHNIVTVIIVRNVQHQTIALIVWRRESSAPHFILLNEVT